MLDLIWSIWWMGHVQDWINAWFITTKTTSNFVCVFEKKKIVNFLSFLCRTSNNEGEPWTRFFFFLFFKCGGPETRPMLFLINVLLYWISYFDYSTISYELICTKVIICYFFNSNYYKFFKKIVFKI
jgi:hypothetical protein